MNESTITISKCMKQNLIALEGKAERPTVIPEGILAIDRTSRQKVSKDIKG